MIGSGARVIERPSSIRAPERGEGRRVAVVLGASIIASVVVGWLAGTLASGGQTMVLVALLVPFVPVLAWRRPVAAVTGLGLLAIVIEQYRIGEPGGDVTDHVPLFTSLSDGLHLSGVYVNPMEILVVLVLLVFLIRATERGFTIPRTRLALGLALLVGLVLAGLVHGLLSHGDYKMALWEIRPTIYVALGYLLAAQLPARAATITAVLWAFVLGVGFKAFQGLALLPGFLAAHPRPDYLLSHEDSFFFCLYIVLVAGLWLFRQKGRLRAVATVLLPIVVVVNLANNRRTSWAILGATFVVLAVVAWIRVPDRRRLLAGAGVAVVLAAAVYLPLYWNKGGVLAGPAAAVRSQFAPSLRDYSSDLYRTQENANLAFNIKRSPLIGAGYGIPIDYALPMIADLTRTDAFLRYIPHNDALYVWMRLGAVGALVFWTFIGMACVAACRVLRAADPHLALYGAFALCAMVAYLILGGLDLGFFWFRVAVTIGVVLGALEVAARADRKEAAPA